MIERLYYWHDPLHAARVQRTARCTVLLLCALALGACAIRPPATDFPRQHSSAIPADTPTPLSRSLAPVEAAHPGESGFHLLITGAEALQARIALARAATKTLDMQYYIANEDKTGKLLLEAVLRAADRGVRVRLLVDDLNFKDIDQIMAVLNAHPHIQIRVFNPFGTAGESLAGRAGNALTHLDRLTRRMHNKAMIADNQISIVGGRNLGDEYFDASPNLRFRDLDILGAGPITADISASFDQFWNSDEAYPLRTLNRQRFSAKKIAAVGAQLRAHWRKSAATFDANPVSSQPLGARIASGRLALVWAQAELRVDTPNKIDISKADYVSPPMHHLGELARQAHSEFLIISPYFVPHDAGIKMLAGLVKRGVRVSILTNSLAATDAIAVQAGYGPYRVPLLKAGVKLYEFKPIQGHSPPGLTGSKSKASLHAKVFVIDRKIVVIGSMNLDRRSASLNTELALFIHSPALAEQVAKLFERGAAPTSSYQVLLAPPELRATMKAVGDPPSPLIWISEEDGHMVQYDFDPKAGLWRNLMTGLFFLLPIKNQL